MTCFRFLLLTVAVATSFLPAGTDAEEPPLSFARDSEAREGEGYSIPVSPPLRRLLSRDDFLEELGTQGIDLPYPRSDALPTRSREEIEQRRIEEARAEVLDYAKGKESATMIDLIVMLDELPFDNVAELRQMSGDAYRTHIGVRQSSILDAQDAFAEHVLGYGHVVAQARLVNAMHIRVPASDVERALDHPDVRSVHGGWHRVVSDYNGDELREATLLQSFADADVLGEAGGRVTTPVSLNDNIKIGIMELATTQPMNAINTFHPGWLDESGGATRILSNIACIGSPCNFASPSLFADHGTYVAWVAAGSIEEGQSPTFPGIGTPEQARRSGVAREAALYYYRIANSANGFTAMDLAAASGVDVLNMSFRFGDCPLFCVKSNNCGGINALLPVVADLGMLVVKAASNEHDEDNPGACTVTYPGYRPEAVAIGNVLTTGSIDYDAALIARESSRGMMDVGMGGSWGPYFSGASIPAVSMAAPGVISLYFSDFGLFGTTEIEGTSFAAPVITGAAGLLRESLGLASSSAHRLKAVVLAMGDGTDVPLVGPGWEGGVPDTWGTGKIKAHRLDTLPGPSQYLIVQDHLDEAEEIRRAFPAGPLPVGVAQWKWVAHVYHPSLDEVPWVAAEARDACNGDVVVAGDYQFGPVKYLSLSAPRLPPASCLETRLYGISVAPGGVEVHSVAYYSSGDPNDH
ncbi:MAG: S8 family serine peptidase [Myxococcota bacterium]